MRLRDYFFLREKALAVSPSVLEYSDRVSPVPLIATPPGAAGLIRDAYVEVQSGAYGWIYSRQPAVRTVIDYIARNASQLGLHLFERLEADDRQSADDHPAAQTVRRPLPGVGSRRFVFDIVVQLLCFDNAYAVKFRGEGDKRLLLPIPTHMVGLVGPDFYVTQTYRIYRPDGTSRDVPAEDVVHWRGTDPDDPRQGVSKLETLRLLLAEERASQEATIQQVKSGNLKPGYIWRGMDAPDLEIEDEERILADWTRAVKDPSTRPPMLHEGMEFRDFGLSPREAEMLDGRRFTREEVAAQYGMIECPPKTMEGRQLIFLDVLQPLLRHFTEVLDVQLVEAEYGRDDLYFEFANDQMMETERLKALTSASGRPVLLTDEARSVLDLPPVKGGDELVTPANVIVGSNPKPSPMIMPIQDPNKPEQDGSFREQAVGKYDPNQPRDEWGRWGDTFSTGGPGAGGSGPKVPDEPSGPWKRERDGVYSNGGYLIFRDTYEPIRDPGERGSIRWEDLDIGGEQPAWIVALKDKPEDNLWIADTLKEAKQRAHYDWQNRVREAEKAFGSRTKQLEVTTLPRFQADRRRQKRNINVFDAVLSEHFARQRGAYRANGKSMKGFADSVRWTAELGKNLLRGLRMVVDREGGIYVARLGGDDFDLSRTDNYLKTWAEESAAGINEATQANIEDLGADDAFARAEQRTAAAASSLGTRSTFWARKVAGEQAPNPEARRMIWRANTDRHRHLDGKSVPLDGDWGGIYPGSEPGCECSCDVL